MHSHASKTSENKNQAVASHSSRVHSDGASLIQFVDKRPEALIQMKLQEISRQSKQALQLEAFQGMTKFAKHNASVQRFEDLNAKYADSDKVNDVQKQEWLPEFKKIQLLLNDTESVKTKLAALAAYMGTHNVTLNDALVAHESGTWTDVQPILIDFVPEAVFEDFVSRGQLFVDLVGKSHGVQTHRIQWYIIQAEFGQAFAKKMYAESVNPRWKKGKNMWDWIVDGVNASAGDFTQPDRLEDYLIEQFESLCTRSDLGKLHGEVKEGHESQRDDRKAMKEMVPPHKAFTKSMKTVMQEHKNLVEEYNWLAGQEAKAKEDNTLEVTLTQSIKENEHKRSLLVESIQFEKVTYRSGAGLFGRGGQAYIFTGWILGTGVQGGSSPTYFAPTVAYPAGADTQKTVF